MEQKAALLHMGPARCSVDLGDGSERGNYVNQDYIINKLGRPHRAVSLMYCYYPLDEGWPKRASVAHAGEEVSFQWDYPYDDYFTYKGGLGGSLDDEPFTSMRDVRRHGQDVLLTLTIDPKVSDEHLIAIAKDLRTFGHVQLRINHEADGSWFSFNKRATYEEVAQFYIRCHDIITKYAPNVKTILCLGGIEKMENEKIAKEEEFAPAVRQTDIWSVDKYISLHYGWPYDVAEHGGSSHFYNKPQEVYALLRKTYFRYLELNQGVKKPMVLSELNTDGDVTGQINQAKDVREFCELIKNDEDHWLNGFTLYQFRDNGRLGLELTDPNNAEVGIEQPLLQEYKKIIAEDFFNPVMTKKEEAHFPLTLRWGGSEDADGVAVSIDLEKNPVFFEVNFDEELVNLNLMMKIHGQWFYKAPQVKSIDVMPAFWANPIEENTTEELLIFAPPASGENTPDDGEDWLMNSYTSLPKLPDFRIRYVPTEE